MKWTIGTVLAVAMLSGDSCRGQDDQVQKRVKELLNVVERPNPRGEDLKRTVAAMNELEQIGEAATPQLVSAAIKADAVYVRKLLVRIGSPALPAIKAKWGNLNDEQRWLLMPVREKYDKDSVWDYVWNCLESKGPARLEAWMFVIRTKDPRAEDRYFKALEGGEPPSIRLELLPRDKPIYDERRESDILIGLLDSKSWLAKGEGQSPPDGNRPPWWPDGRPKVIYTLHQRKVARAAPALLKVLEEKGRGEGYLAEQIIPALADLGYKEAIPELERISLAKPKSGEMSEAHPYTLSDYRSVRELAATALKRLNDPKR